MTAKPQPSETTKLPPPSRQDAPGSVFTPETTMDSEIADQERKLAGEALWEEFQGKDRIKTREINTLTVENRKLLNALRKAKEALEPHAKLFGVDGASPCDKCRAYAAILEGLNL